MLELVEFNNTLTVEVNSESGCYYHRIGNPLRYVDINPKAPTLYFSRLSGFAPWQMKEMRAQGVNIVMDLDDDIILPRNHVLYDAYKQQGTTEKMIENIELASVVLVTNEALASSVRNYNPNVEIVPNALPFDEDQFTYNSAELEYDIVYVGSVTHEHDLALVHGCFDHVSVKMCGVADNPIWERIMKAMPSARPFSFAPLDEYMSLYDGSRVAIAPLENNRFNACKSNLKVLEAGAKGIPIIVSKVHPYLNQIDEDVVIYAGIKESWIAQMNKLLRDPVYYAEKSQQLSEHVREHYSLRKVNQLRKQIIEGL